MKIFYRSLFIGWVEVTEKQKENLIKHMVSGITTMSGEKRKNYINSKFQLR